MSETALHQTTSKLKDKIDGVLRDLGSLRVEKQREIDALALILAEVIDLRRKLTDA